MKKLARNLHVLQANPSIFGCSRVSSCISDNVNFERCCTITHRCKISSTCRCTKVDIKLSAYFEMQTSSTSITFRHCTFDSNPVFGATIVHGYSSDNSNFKRVSVLITDLVDDTAIIRFSSDANAVTAKKLETRVIKKQVSLFKNSSLLLIWKMSLDARLQKVEG